MWVLVVVAAPAAADTGAEQRFRDGRRLLETHQLVEACAAFEDSEREDPRPATLLNLGDCQEQRGFAATARETFIQASLLAERTNDRRRLAEANRRIAAIEPLVAKLTIVVEPVDGLTVRRNGAAIEPAQWNTAVALDPGRYTIEVGAPGHRGWSTTYELAAKEQARIVVAALAPEPGPSPRLALAAPPTPPPTPTRTVAVGSILGLNIQHEAALVGVRVQAAIAAPGGQLRSIAMFGFSRYPDEPAQPTFSTSTYTVAASAEYLWLPSPTLALGGGLGIGADYDAVTPKLADRTNDLGPFFSIHASPLILRLRHETVEAGLHVSAVMAGDEVTVNCVAAVDWFVW